jgi:hypothetical protein
MNIANDNGLPGDDLLLRLQIIRDAVGREWELPFCLHVMLTVHEAIGEIALLRTRLNVSRAAHDIARERVTCVPPAPAGGPS